MLTQHAQPIAAIATAPGRGAVGIVRLSGKGLAPLVEQLLGKLPAARMASYLPFPDAGGQPIDHGLALWFPAPHSYTGEDVLELQAHGGSVVLQMLLAHCLQQGESLGLRVARPGEFTERAFLNGKLDLAQAEAVADLIDATTQAAARSAVRSLQGEFSREIRVLTDELIELRALTEATLDFPEEEIDFLKAANAFGRLDSLAARLEAVFDRARQGRLLQNGLHVVLAGQPNVGKSSLLNGLAGDELAIVTPIAGTTRDVVRGNLQIEGIPLHVIDTAGLRETEDEVERLGIERTWREIEKADVLVLLADAREGIAHGEEAILRRLPPDLPRITVYNKIDLTDRAPERHEEPEGGEGCVAISLSAKSGAGLDLLRRELLRIAGWHEAEDVFIARERHLRALAASQEHLQLSRQRLPALELFAEELRMAQNALCHITGEFTADDLLGEIFGRFCIGK